MRRFLSILLIIVMAAGAARPLLSSAEMTSTNYTIYADTISAGGLESAGGTYDLQDTLGESPAGVATSTSYEVRGGYQSMVSSSLSISLSAGSVSLGDLDVTSVKSANVVAAVSTDSEGGYSLSISGVSGSALAAVADGSVTAGSEEYGFSASGADVQLASGDWAVVAGLVLASNGAAVYDRQTTLTFKASRGGATLPGSYSQVITLAAVGNI